MSKPLKELIEATDMTMEQALENRDEMARRLRALDEYCNSTPTVSFNAWEHQTISVLEAQKVRRILDGEE